MIGARRALLNAGSRDPHAWVAPGAAFDIDFVNQRAWGGALSDLIVNAGGVYSGAGLLVSAAGQVNLIGALLAAATANAGTAIVETAGIPADATGDFRGVYGSASEGARLLYTSDAPSIRSFNGSGLLNAAADGATRSAVMRSGFRWDAGAPARAICVNGGAIDGDANAPWSAPPVDLELGFTFGAFALGAYVRRFTLFPSALGDAAFQAAATP